MRVLRLVGFAAVVLGGLVVAVAAAFVLGAAADSIPSLDDIFDSSLPRWLVGLGLAPAGRHGASRPCVSGPRSAWPAWPRWPWVSFPS